MKVLQIISDWKWTGPAEPVVSLTEALSKAGVDVTIACRKTPIDFKERTIEKEIKKRGLKSLLDLRLNRYFSPKDWLFDFKNIRRYVEEEGFEVIHTNLSHDHFQVILSFLFSKERPIIIRTDHKRDGMPRSYTMRWAISRTDGIVTYSNRIMERDRVVFGLPEERLCIIPPGIRPYDGEIRDMRGEFGIGEKEKVIGVIGRLKPDRGYDVILKAFKRLCEEMDGVRLLIMGRSSQIEESIMRPMAELGVEEQVILAGYRVDDYFSVLSLFDVFVMMRAGSDGTARALREVMAMGKPAIVSNMGMLPELVKDNETGYVVEPEPNILFERLKSILTDEERLRRFGENAKRVASETWNYDIQAATLKAFYERLIKTRPNRSS